MDIYDRIDALIKQHGLTRRKLATMANIAPTTLNSAFSRRSGLSVETVSAIAKVLEADANYILTGQTLEEFSEEYIARILKSRADAEAADALYTAYGFTRRLEGDNWIIIAPDGSERVFDPQERRAYGTIITRELKEFAHYLHHKAVKEVLGEE